jgi:hypothetical protein
MYLRISILTGLILLIAGLSVLEAVLSLQVWEMQGQAAAEKKLVDQANIFKGDLKQVAVRIYKDSVHTHDEGLKELLTREQITYPPNTNSPPNPPSAPPTAQ